MSADIGTTGMTDLDESCWCCGREFGEANLVRLGSHPEVGLCLDCARWVHRRAAERRDAGRRGPFVRSRAAVRAARALVMRRGWHERRILGPILRWLDRLVP